MDPRMIDYIHNSVRNDLTEQENKRLELENRNFSLIDKVNIENHFGGKYKDKKGYDCIFADLGYNS